MNNEIREVINEKRTVTSGHQFRIGISEHQIIPLVLDAEGKRPVSGVIDYLGFDQTSSGLVAEFKVRGTRGQQAEIHLPYLDRVEIYPIEVG